MGEGGMDAAGGTAGMDAQTLKEFGNECFKKRDFAKALECYSNAIDLRPEASLSAPRVAEREHAGRCVGAWAARHST